MDKSQNHNHFKWLFHINILGMIGAQFYTFFEMKHQSKMLLFAPQKGEYINEDKIELSFTFRGGVYCENG
jgi:hypothetical protein